MQGDNLLQEWRQAKETCYKIIEIAKDANIHGKTHLSRQSNKEFLAVYDIVYRLCVNREREETRVSMVYKDYKDILKEALLSMCQLIQHQQEIYKLSFIRKIWDAYNDILKRLLHMFAYLNRSYHIKEGKIEELDKTGMVIIATTLFNEQQVQEYEFIFFRELDRIRKTSDFSNAHILKDMVDIYYQMHLKLVKNINRSKARTLYTEFHGSYLKKARAFYKTIYVNLKQINSSEYFIELGRIYEKEQRISNQCFGIQEEVLIHKQFSQQLINPYKETLLKSEKGLRHILKNQEIETLKIIVKMYTELTNNIDGFKEELENYIFEEMKLYMSELSGSFIAKKNNVAYCTFIQKLIKKNNEFISVLSESLMQFGDFATYYKSGIEKAFAYVQLPIEVEEMLAIYCDIKLKNNSMSEEQIEQEMTNILGLFFCMQNKDLFQLKYIQKLSKRLITMTPETLSNHQVLINSLKMNCGMKYTQRLQALIYEYYSSAQSQKQLKTILEQERIKIDVNLKIFGEGIWPNQNIIEIPLQFLPTEYEQCVSALSRYRDEFSPKKTFRVSSLESRIRWIYYFHKEENMKFSECYFDTNCLQGALVYYIYQKRPEKVALEVLQFLFEKIDKKLLKENLGKMSEIKEGNILIKTIQNQEKFYEFNHHMKSHKRLISYDIGPIEQEEKLFQQQTMHKDRQLILDANVAKYMKSKKITSFEVLIPEVIKMVRVFVPQKKDIKQAIGRLINKDIIERDPKNPLTLKYVD